jgi:hypothetical protein
MANLSDFDYFSDFSSENGQLQSIVASSNFHVLVFPDDDMIIFPAITIYGS